MNKYIILFVLSCLSFLRLYGGGKNTYDFLRNDVSARAAALGGSFLTMGNDVNTIFYNPASLVFISEQSISFGYFKHLLDINAGHICYGTSATDLGYLGIGVVYINYGEFIRRGEEGQILGKFNASEFAIYTGYANYFDDKISYGVNFKVIFSSIAEVNSYASAIDLGVNYNVLPNTLILGTSLLNLGTQLSTYKNKRENLPLDFKIGGTIYPAHLPAAISLNLHKINEAEDKILHHLNKFSIGVEFTVSPNVQLRFGFNNEKRRELKLGTSAGLAGLSLGGGVKVDRYLFDYAYSSLGKIGAFHRVNIGFKF